MVKKISLILLSLILTAVVGLAVGLGLTTGDKGGGVAAENGTGQGGSTVTDGSASSGGTATGGSAEAHVCEFTVLTDEKGPGCISGGYKLYSCSRPGCGKTSKTESGALGHDYKPDRTEEATCSEDEKHISVCSRCGDEKTETVTGKRPHTYGEYGSNGDATCGADGTKTARCTKCGAEKTVADKGSATGAHVFGEYTPDNNGTCIKDGTQSAICKNCGAADSVTLPDSKDEHNHNYIWTVISETCSSCSRHGVCAWCNGVTEEVTVVTDVFCDYKAIETKNAGCTVDGYVKKVCAKCGDTVTEPVYASGQHSPNGNGVCTLCGEAVGVCNGKIYVEFNYYGHGDCDFGTVYAEVVVVNPEYRKQDNGLWVMKYILYIAQTYTVDGQTYTTRRAVSLDRPDEIGSTFGIKLTRSDKTEVSFSGIVDYSVDADSGRITVCVNGQASTDAVNYSFDGRAEITY